MLLVRVAGERVKHGEAVAPDHPQAWDTDGMNEGFDTKTSPTKAVDALIADI